MNGKNLQTYIFQEIEKLYPEKNKVIADVASVLHLSPNAAYKRIKGLTSLNLDDLVSLCQHFKISLDKFISNDKENVLFQFSNLERQPKTYSEYLEKMHDLAKASHLMPSHEIHLYYATNEFPIHYYFSFQEINYFKYYNWAWSNWGFDTLKTKKLSLTKPIDPTDEFTKITDFVADATFKVPCTDFLSKTALYNTLEQIKYFVSIEKYESEKDPFSVCESIREMLKHIMSMAEVGLKFKPGETPNEESPAFSLFYNEITQTNNVSILTTPYGNHTFSTFDNPNTIYTQNSKMSDYAVKWFEKLKKGSIALSKSSAKTRFQYFSHLFNEVEKTEEELAVMLKEK